MRKRLLLGGVVAALGALTTACNPSLRVEYWRPAEVNLREIKRIAVGGVWGYGADEIKPELEQVIFDSGRFELVDRTHTAQILAEIGFQNSGLVDEAQAAQLGKLFGAAALIFVNVKDYGWQDKYESSTWKDDKGVTHTKWTYTKWGTVDAAFQVIDCETGKILAIKNLKGYHEAIAVEDDRKPNPDSIDPKYLIDQARAEVLNKFIKVIAPYKDYAWVRFYKDKNIPQMEEGIRYAQAGNWEKAAEVFNAAYAAYPNSDKVMYNLGVTYEYSGRFQEALDLLEKAYATKPLGSYQREIANCRRLWDEYKRLQEQAPVE